MRTERAPRAPRRGAANLRAGAARCRRKFLRFFPGGFADETYIDWERGYKWQAHERWCGFIARPEHHVFLKPTVTRVAAREYGFDFRYQSRPSWDTYASLLEFAEVVRHDVGDLEPRDMIDIQSFIWVQGSDEYEE